MKQNHTQTPPPKLSFGVDHLHFYVASRKAAAAWFAKHFDFHIRDDLAFWTGPHDGPMTIQSRDEHITLALFKTKSPRPVTVAFGCSAEEFISWRNYFTTQNLAFSMEDHDVTFSLYLKDPDNNVIEITTYAHEDVKAKI